VVRAGAGASTIRSTASFGLLHDQLCPHVHRRRELEPSLVDLLDVEPVVDVRVLQEMEQEQRNVGVGPGRDVRHRRRAGDPRVQLAEVDLVGVDVDQHVHLEEALVALSPEPSRRTRSTALARWSSDRASGNRSLPHHPPL
jgi:hypothetical protein